MSSVVFGCRECGKGVEVTPGEQAQCPVCLTHNDLPASDGTLNACLACSCDEIYRHRDFNQKLGLALIGIGAIAWFVWTTFWPLAIAAVLDVVLYFTLPDVGICYRCKAHHRGFSAITSLPGFDLERHEHYKHVRAREEGQLPPRPEKGASDADTKTDQDNASGADGTEKTNDT